MAAGPDPRRQAVVLAVNALLVSAEPLPFPRGPRGGRDASSADADREEDGRQGEFHYRLLFAPAGDVVVYLLEVSDERALPRSFPRAALIAEITGGALREAVSDRYLPPVRVVPRHPTREELERKQRAEEVRDRRWEMIADLVTDPEYLVLDETLRGGLVREAATRAGVSPSLIYRQLRRYWRGGQTWDALLPHFERCGGPGKRRAAGTAKRGRQRSLNKVSPEAVGMNISAADRAILVSAGRQYVTRGGMTLSEAYTRLIEKYYSTRVWRGGEVRSVPLPANERPSKDQFRYWHRRSSLTPDAYLERVGVRRYVLRHRPALGSSTDGVSGPGALYQVDATVGDIYLLSEVIPGRVIGRPVIYIVVDSFSRMIVGLHVCLEGPSWAGLMLALENAFCEKVTFCSGFGVEIEDEDWPSRHLCDALLGDRGELLAKHGNEAAKALHIDIQNTGSYRADWKGIVERRFGFLNDQLIRWQPGAVCEARERGDPDYRLDATLTLADLTEMLILLVLHHNCYRPVPNDAIPLDFPFPAGGNPTPLELWNWGLKHRSGHLRVADRDRVRVNLLPQEPARITDEGIRLHGLRYEPADTVDPSVLLEQDAGRAALNLLLLRRLPRPVSALPASYDPRDVGTIWVHVPGGTHPVECRLIRGDRRFAGHTLEEVQDARAVNRASGRQQQEARLADDVALLERVENVTAKAKARRKEALGPNQKAGIKDIRGVRKVERDVVRRDGAWSADRTASGAPGAPSADSGAAVPPATVDLGAPCPPAPPLQAADDGYVPRPSQRDLLRAARRTTDHDRNDPDAN